MGGATGVAIGVAMLAAGVVGAESIALAAEVKTGAGGREEAWACIVRTAGAGAVDCAGAWAGSNMASNGGRLGGALRVARCGQARMTTWANSEMTSAHCPVLRETFRPVSCAW